MDFQASENHIAFAAKWAALFCKDKPEREQEFIEHYIKRTLVKRFWGDACNVNGERVAFCRLGEELMLVFHKGRIHKLEIKREKVIGLKLPPGELGPTRKKARFMQNLERKLGSADGTHEYETQFDAMTSFSKQAGHQAILTMYRDIPKSFSVYPQPQKNRYAGFYSVSVKKYTGWLGLALKQFLTEVDQDILHATRSVRCPSISLYNWIAGGNSARRLQAVKAYPVLVPMEVLLKRGRYQESKIDELTELVDKGESFNEILAGMYKITGSAMKKVGKLSPYSIGSAISFLKYEFERSRFNTALHAFNLGSKRPQKAAGWKNCMDALTSTDLRFNERAMAGMPAWESKEWCAIIPQIRSLYDIGGARHIVAKAGLKKLLSFSTEWHEKQHEIQEDVLSQVEKRPCYSWPAMLKGEITHPATGLKIVEITDNLSLAQEGSRMGHCVGGYAGLCYAAKSRIISIRDGKKPLATLEYRPVATRDGKKSYVCVQAQGPRNRSFSGTPAHEAFEWLKKNLKQYIATYSPEPVPRHLQPIGRHDLSRQVAIRIQEWSDARLIQLGYGEEVERIKATRDQDDYY